MDLPFHRDALPPGSRLGNWLVEDVISISRRAIIYRASGIEAAEVVAIKEYFPSELVSRDAAGRVVPRGAAAEATYRAGLRHFTATMHALCELTAVRRVHGLEQVREIVRTGDVPLAVLTFEPGPTLGAALEAGAAFGEAALVQLLRTVGGGLAAAHAIGINHAAITPSDIILSPGGSAVLIGFGAAGRGIDASQEPSPYAPVEQYAEVHACGPWTDIYRLGAVLHHAVCGKPPAEVTNRTAEGVLARAAPAGFGRPFLDAVDRAMEIGPQRRPQSVADWLMLLPEAVSAEPAAEAAPSVVTEVVEPEDVPASQPRQIIPRAAVPVARNESSRIPAGPVTAIVGLMLTAAALLLFASPEPVTNILPPSVRSEPAQAPPEPPERLDAELARATEIAGRMDRLRISVSEAGLPPAVISTLDAASNRAKADVEEARRLRSQGQGPRLNALRDTAARLAVSEAEARRTALAAYVVDGERMAVSAAGDIVAFATLSARDAPQLERLRGQARQALRTIEAARAGLQSAGPDPSDATLARTSRDHAMIAAQARIIARRLAEARALPRPAPPRLLPVPVPPPARVAVSEPEPAPVVVEDDGPATARPKLRLLRNADRQLRAVQAQYDRLRARLGRGRPDRPYGGRSIYGEAESIYDALFDLRGARTRIARAGSDRGAERAYARFAAEHGRLATRITALQRAL